MAKWARFLTGETVHEGELLTATASAPSLFRVWVPFGNFFLTGKVPL